MALRQELREGPPPQTGKRAVVPRDQIRRYVLVVHVVRWPVPRERTSTRASNRIAPSLTPPAIASCVARDGPAPRPHAGSWVAGEDLPRARRPAYLEPGRGDRMIQVEVASVPADACVHPGEPQVQVPERRGGQRIRRRLLAGERQRPDPRKHRARARVIVVVRTAVPERGFADWIRSSAIPPNTIAPRRPFPTGSASIHSVAGRPYHSASGRRAWARARCGHAATRTRQSTPGREERTDGAVSPVRGRGVVLAHV